MKYRVINKNSEWLLQYTINVYISLEYAYINLLKFETNNQCILKPTLKFPHNKNNGEYVWCKLKIGKLNPVNKDYNEGKHYYAGYKPENYGKFYYCSYGKSYKDAINKLWCDLEVQKILHKFD